MASRWTALAACLVTGCAPPDITDGPWRSEVTRSGDTTVVRTLSGSTWQKPARLVEELRIGSLGGEDGTAFGSIDHVVVDDDGSIFLFDGQAPALHRFAASGDFLGTIGGEGEGPGEYSDNVTGMTLSGGRLLLADPGTGRLSSYSRDGAFEGSLGSVTGLRSLFSPTLSPGPGGGVAVRVLTMAVGPGVEIPTPWPIGLELRGPDGAVSDTVPPPSPPGPSLRMLIGGDGAGVLVDSPGEFDFHVRWREGSVTRWLMPFQRVAYTDGERALMGITLAPAASADGRAEAPTPALKGAYLEFLTSADGRIWARRPVADREGEPTWSAPLHQPSALDVFDGDGAYLGVVPLPTTARPVWVTPTHVYVVELGSFDESYLVRYRVETPK